ncbi:hypothetical protein DFH09DRAFT_1219595 [Mycena vulgaris]|nr:hypothetical protein DFH09DRAFT_1219595 [Mycena vulgaris]
MSSDLPYSPHRAMEEIEGLPLAVPCLRELDGEVSHDTLHSDDERPIEQSIDLDTIRDSLTVAAHPILALPPEILSEIFIECLPIYSATPDPLRAPMLLGSICGGWRKVALSTPWLWNSFILSVNLGRATEGSAMMQLFECWLSRGGNCPLTMVISCYPGNKDILAARSAGPLPDSLIRALSHCSSRWHDVNLVLPFTDFYRLQAYEGLPILRRLAIKALADASATDPNLTLPPCLNLFKVAPVLQDVYLGDGFPIPNVILPLHQLKYFDSRMAAAVHYLHVLREAPQLVEIGLELRTLRHMDMPPAPIHSNIKSLTLRSWENSFLDVLDFLTCPALETLVISGYGFAPLPPHPLLRFLSRSSPPLTKFVVDFPHSSSDALIQVAQCLIAMPNLVRLDMKSLTVATANDVFNRMCDHNSLFLPKLRTFRVDVNVGLNGPSSWTYDAMIRMLVARWNSPSSDDVVQLQAFCLSSSSSGPRLSPYTTDADNLRNPDPTTFSQLSALAREGMDIEIDLGHNGEGLPLTV